jgi:ribosome-associated protein YbcJ (S4-like RNA binding protein)
MSWECLGFEGIGMLRLMRRFLALGEVLKLAGIAEQGSSAAIRIAVEQLEAEE